jgi:hypothetical protein
MKILLFIVALSCIQAQAQSVTTIEVYGSVPAIQVYNGLGTNITNTNSWEYTAAQAAHITWGRFDCGWTSVELIKGTYTLPSACSQGLSSSSTYGVHPIVDALYGPPYTTIATGTLTTSTTTGSTTPAITVSTGSLSTLVNGQTELLMSPQWSSKASYSGALITGLSGTTFTMASAATSNFSSGAAMSVNLLFYPPILIPSGQGYNAYRSNASALAYVNFAHYLAQQVAAASLTGEVSLWNEPPWSGDPWDMGPNLYNTPPSNGAIEPGTPGLGIEVPLYAANLGASVTGVPYDNGYTETSGWVGSLFFPNLIPWQSNVFTYKTQFATESFHPYGNNPEDATWLGTSCLQANLSNLNNIYAACTPTGAVEGSSEKTAVAASMVASAWGGVGHSITETGLATATGTSTQVTRFEERQFLTFQALGVTPVVFYRLYDTSGQGFGWFASEGNPNPVYTAFQGLMIDIGSIANSPVAPYSACMMPRVSSYTGYYPLATMTFVGSTSGNHANSLLYYSWQRTYGSTWVDVSSPSTVNVSVVVPTGLTVSSVKDMLTGASVSYTFTSQTLTYPVADDPIEVLIVPTSASVGPTLTCT